LGKRGEKLRHGPLAEGGVGVSDLGYTKKDSGGGTQKRIGNTPYTKETTGKKRNVVLQMSVRTSVREPTSYERS